MARFSLNIVALAAILIARPVGAQDATNSGITSTPSQQSQGAPASGASERSGIDRLIALGMQVADRSSGSRPGFHAEFGGLIPGAGVLAVGPGYSRPLFSNAARFDAAAVMSVTRYVTVNSSLEWPGLRSNRLSLRAEAKYQDFPQVNDFGIGARSSNAGLATYHFTGYDVLGSATVRPADWLTFGTRAGYMQSRASRSSDEAPDATTRGLNASTPFAHADVFVGVDRRDAPGYPRKGGVYRASLTAFHDLDGSGQSFMREEVEGAHYVPLFHDNWVLAMRARLDLSQPTGGQDVPFYLLPTLGGENSLRGYANYRFRDRNAALVSAEYRWPLFQALDAAIFMDAGTVAGTAGDITHNPVRTDYGIGLRVHSATRSIARLDIARGQEGTRVLVSFRAPLHSASRIVAPFVP